MPLLLAESTAPLLLGRRRLAQICCCCGTAGRGTRAGGHAGGGGGGGPGRSGGSVHWRFWHTRLGARLIPHPFRTKLPYFVEEVPLSRGGESRWCESLWQIGGSWCPLTLQKVEVDLRSIGFEPCKNMPFVAGGESEVVEGLDAYQLLRVLV